MLELQHIHKTLAATAQKPARVLLNDVSLQLKAGQTVAVLGASGSGKSTLLKIIAGLEPFESGTVAWAGQDLARTPTHRRRFALMFQQFALFAHLNVADNVAFGLVEQGVQRAQARLRAVDFLRDYGLASAAHQSVDTLSGGEQQRVALARALITQPKVLLLDEPFSALDADLRSAMQRLFCEKIAQYQIATVLVTHDETEARGMASHGWRITQAQLQPVWSPSQT